MNFEDFLCSKCNNSNSIVYKSNKLFFECNSCNNIEIIDSNYILYKTEDNKITKNIINKSMNKNLLSIIKNDNTLKKTKSAKCPNNCKNPEFSIIRLRKDDIKVYYLCHICNEIF